MAQDPERTEHRQTALEWPGATQCTVEAASLVSATHGRNVLTADLCVTAYLALGMAPD